MRMLFCVFVCVLWNVGTNAYASPSCSFQSWRDLGRVLSETSPSLESLKAKADLRAAESSAARLAPSSLLNAQYTSGGWPWRSSSLESSYLWTLESSEKKDSRSAAALAAGETIPLERADLVSKQLLELGLMQENFRRIRLLREILGETEETYSNIIRLYQRIPSRGPEQETSLAVFQIAKGENDLKVKILDLEEVEYQSQLRTLTACQELSVKDLGPIKAPRLAEENEVGDRGPEILLNAETKLVDLGLRAEEENAKADLSIGPMAILERDEDGNRLEFGLALSYPLGGERIGGMNRVRQAEAKVRRLTLDNERVRLSQRKGFWRAQYDSARLGLTNGISPEQIAKKHKALEGLFRSDRVSAALVIEAHRQMLDHIKGYAELEFKAVEAKWNLRYLEGRLDGEEL